MNYFDKRIDVVEELLPKSEDLDCGRVQLSQTFRAGIESKGQSQGIYNL